MPFHFPIVFRFLVMAIAHRRRIGAFDIAGGRRWRKANISAGRMTPDGGFAIAPDGASRGAIPPAIDSELK